MKYLYLLKYPVFLYPSHHAFPLSPSHLPDFQSPLWANCKSSVRRRERDRQVVQHNELNEAKQIMSECMAEERYYSWTNGRCFHSLNQARTHTGNIIHIPGYGTRNTGKGEEAPSPTRWPSYL